MPHDYGLEGAKRLLPTYRHHRHRQLRLFEDLVVLRILGESRKLREPGPHSTWLRVSRGKEISGGFVGPTWIAGKVIPYSVNEALDLIGINRGVGVCHHVANVVSDHRCFVVSQRSHNGTNILGLSLFIVAIGSFGGTPNATEIRHYHRVVLHEICGQRSPRIAIFSVPMDEHHYGPASSPTSKNARPIRAVYCFRLKAGRQGRRSLA